MRAARAFIDTNIWIYAHLRVRGDVRHARASAVLKDAPEQIISPQVVAEYYSVMLRNKREDAWIQANLRAMFARTRLQPANASVVSTSLELRNRYGWSFWDCQIAAAALESGCSVLLTEDLPHGQTVDGRLQIRNPLAD